MISYKVDNVQYADGSMGLRIVGHCLSTDTKPTDDIANGSQLIEIDTGDVYLFNEAAETWVKQGASEVINNG